MHKLSTAVFAQGWLEGQFENALKKASETANEDPSALLIATQVQEQWSIVSSTLDRLIKENGDMEHRLNAVKAALQ